MNELPFPLREAAKELYLYKTLNEVVNLKKGKTSKELALRYHFNSEQWQMIADAVILARLPQYRLLKYFDRELLEYLKTLLLDALQMPGFSCEEAVRVIEQDAPTLAVWVRHLQKQLSQH